jgi:uncharacterized protein
MIKSYKYLLLTLITLFTIQGFSSKDKCFPEKSNRLVNDYTGTLNSTQLINLEQKLIDFDKATSTQIAIVIVKELCGYDKAGYTIELAEMWEIGQEGSDNGILIMLKPTGGGGQRHTFIATGYGLEGVIPDATAKRIVEEEMLPRFKVNDYYGGLDKACDVLMKLSTGEFKAEDYNRPKFGNDIPWGSIIFIGFFVLIIVFGRYNGVRRYSRKNKVSLWTAFWLISASSSSRNGSYGGFSGGSSNFGGGGGFGGFGGGSFGGGGAGGSW